MRKILLLLSLLFMQPCFAQVGLFVRPNSSSLTAPVSGQTWLFNSSNLTMSVFNGASFQTASAPKNNFTAVLAPTNYNDNTQGYSQASLWYNTVSGYTYECVDVTTNAAIWIQTNNLGSLTIPLNIIQAGGAATGQSLVFNGTHWAPGTQISSLSVLSQSGAVTGQVPLWNGSSWVAGNPPGGSAAVPLSQLAQSGATTGQVPQWNGSAWIPASAGGGSGTVTNVTGLLPIVIAGTTTVTPQITLDSSGSTSTNQYGVYAHTAGSTSGFVAGFMGMMQNPITSNGFDIGGGTTPSYYLVDTTIGDLTGYLVPAALLDGQVIVINNIGANSLTINADSTIPDTINGTLSSITLTSGQIVTIMSNATQNSWYYVSKPN